MLPVPPTELTDKLAVPPIQIVVQHALALKTSSGGDNISIV